MSIASDASLAASGGRPSRATASLNGTAPGQRTGIRWLIVLVLFVATSINYADRGAIGVTGPAIAHDYSLNAAQMGFIFSAFGWAYVIFQLPGGWMLDRFGSRRIYGGSLLVWSLFTAALGCVGFLTGTAAFVALFGLLFLLGGAESPAFPSNSRVVAAWFPRQERATASAIFNAAQYFAAVLFTPLMGWVTASFGWPWVYGMMGGLGAVMALAWFRLVYNPSDHPWCNPAEVDYIAAGGGLVDIDAPARKEKSGAEFGYLRQLFSSRMMVGIFLGQFCINALTYFFITWFPVYLVQARHMTILKAGVLASLPAICGFLGGILGGLFSDWLLRRGHSLALARKTPIVIGMLTAMSMIVCNYTTSDALVVALMAIAFFGKALGALGWAVLSDTAPREITGLAGSVLNMCGNLSSISTPIVIGYILYFTGSFNWVLVFIAANALVAALSFLFIVQDIKRMELKHR